MTNPADMDTSVDEKNTTTEEKGQEKEEEAQSPLLKMATWKFLVSLPDEEFPPAEKAEVKTKMMDEIKEKNMGPYYQHLCEALGWMENEELLKKMKEENAKKLAEFDEKEKDAKENLGDSEVREVKLARADYLAEIGEKTRAVAAYDDTHETTVGIGGKIDLSFAKILVGLAWSDSDIVKAEIATAKSQVESGGDWERRNLLCVYESAFQLMSREFKAASKLLLDSVATFTCYKLFDYNTFIFYCVVVSMVSLDRVTLRKKVIKSPEILQVINEMPSLKTMLFSLYKCQYAEFFSALAEVTQKIKRDFYLAPHRAWFMREVRIVAYKQFLESYRSVTLASMAKTFGVSTAFLDKELSRFIAADRLGCKIDKVSGVVETVRRDLKENQYTDTIKQGDLLLNRIQKLTKFINY